jgi:hypothetical protein
MKFNLILSLISLFMASKVAILIFKRGYYISMNMKDRL